ncbi:hypothetical protein [uncultured Acetobacteroides sp.]|uniref:hypothetical protein n=1 Tax=uncultured Acetobacteroides sp. TaxID=1760811 RepID=UPI0029F4611C|nr:hypothetical protein [uncultured Acetobacteroides sp.]
MKRLLLFSLVGIVGMLGAGKAHAQLHNMGLQMSIVNPKGDANNKGGFNSLYGGLFYEYRFTGVDVDKNELRDHFGLEFGLNYTEFIKKGTESVPSSNQAFYTYFTEINGRPYASVKSNNKGVNFYAAPKYYVTVYPELVELYVMGKVGLQYLNGDNTASAKLSKTVSATNLFYGASLGLEVKLGTVFVGVNYGFDTNSPEKIMKKVGYDFPNAAPGVIPQYKPFNNYDLWGNTVLEFKIKALLNAKD